MKRAIVAAMLGIAGVVSVLASPNALVLFETYSCMPQATLAWSADPSLAPAGLAGQQLGAESVYFTAALWFGIGSNPDEWYQSINDATGLPASFPVIYSGFGNGGGWIINQTNISLQLVDVTGPGLPDYSPGPYTFRIVASGYGPYAGCGGTYEFTEPSIRPPGEGWTLFTQLPAGPPYGSDRQGLMQVIEIPEPTSILFNVSAVGTLLACLGRRDHPSEVSLNRESL